MEQVPKKITIVIRIELLPRSSLPHFQLKKSAIKRIKDFNSIASKRMPFRLLMQILLTQRNVRKNATTTKNANFALSTRIGRKIDAKDFSPLTCITQMMRILK